MTDPTITIAGLEARINSLLSAVQHSNRTTAEIVTMFVEASSNADRLTAERDALAAQLTEVRAELAAAPKVCAIHSYEHGPGPCMTCGAWPPGTRELIAAYQTRIAGLEQAADERSRTGQVSEPERSEWIGAAVAVADALGGSLGPVSGTSGTIDPREWIHFAAGLADRAKKLTARMAELEARPVLTHEILSAAIKKARKVPPYIARQAADEYMPHLGPVTLPSPDRAEEPGSDAEAMRHALDALGPVALPSPDRAEELLRSFDAGVESLDVSNLTDDEFEQGRLASMRAALAKLSPAPAPALDAAFLRRILSATKHGPGGKGDPGICDAACVKCEAERIIARLTAGVPVTPERK